MINPMTVQSDGFVIARIQRYARLSNLQEASYVQAVALFPRKGEMARGHGCLEACCSARSPEEALILHYATCQDHHLLSHRGGL